MSINVLYLTRRVKRLIGKRIQYGLMRNVVPRSTEERRISKNGPRVMANSIPKAGTNLLAQLLRMMPNIVGRWTYHVDETLPGVKRQIHSGHHGQVLTAHIPWSKEISLLLHMLDYRIFLMVRDPRDIAVSNVNYVTRMDLSHPLHPVLATQPDDDARLMTMIEPPDKVVSGLPGVWKNDGLSTFLPWLDEPNCLIVRFEDLVGARGGGSDERQMQTIRKVAEHIGADASHEQLCGYANRLFGSAGSKTFHKGKIGTWREHFMAEHKAAFKRRSGEVLIRLGYESDMEW